MIICVKVKTLDSQTYEFSVDNEITVKDFKRTIEEKTRISADLQRIIYCGRVLVDEKQLKDYDVDGKTVHVVERPPPTGGSNVSTQDAQNRPRRVNVGPNIRGSPIVRALDGMVVGTMTFPVSANNGANQHVSHSLNPSTSFCMNRITVARHMLACAENIAAYLENPERGLNNAPFDILSQGRWTMESTVVEVGISGAAGTTEPTTQNIVDLLHGSVSAALRQNGLQNFQVVQLPTIIDGPTLITSREGNYVGSGTAQPTENTSTNAAQQSETGHNDPVGEPQQENPNTIQMNSSGNNENSTRQRTGTPVLAEVVQFMRSVQTRLEPFIQQYYEILLNDQEYTETSERENSQRLYDRVSEAFHYLSHAQHAISDLMLDLSHNRPRYLSCRPILVEQSGIVSSAFLQPNGNNNDSMAANNNASTQNRAENANPVTTRVLNQQDFIPLNSNNTTSQTSTTVPSTSISSSATGTHQTQARGRGNNLRGLHRMVSPFVLPATQRSVNTDPSNPRTDSDVAELQLNVSRLIQAVVNSAPFDADVHVQINAPNLLFGMPTSTAVTTSNTSTQQTTLVENTNSTETSTQTQPNNQTNAASDTIPTNQARVTTATHPTTATRTRSTARPQVHIANIPSPQMWNTRVVPTNNFSFDRFLPCNSHHIRDYDGREESNNDVQQQTRSRNQSQQRPQHADNIPNIETNIRETLRNFLGPRSERLATPLETIPVSTFNIFADGMESDGRIILNFEPSNLNRVRNELHSFIVESLFGGEAITSENMPRVINNIIQFLSNILVVLPQFDLPDYDARASIENFIRTTLPFIIQLISEDDSDEFGTRLFREGVNFFQKLCAILVICVGRENAEMFVNQIADMNINSNNDLERNAFTALRSQLLPNILRQLDLIEQNVTEVQQFLVIRRPPPDNSTMPMEIETSPIIQNTGVQKKDSEKSLAQPPRSAKKEINAPLPSVVLGTEPWHRNFQQNWIPIITRDLGTQRRQNPQSSFSDAYISGMSSKRRKLLSSNKPNMDIMSLIKDGIKKSINKIKDTPGGPKSISIEEVSASISSDNVVQASYREALKLKIRDMISNNPDFSPEKFPDSSKYFK